MYELIKKYYSTGEVELIFSSNDEEEVLDRLCDFVRENASNGYEYTSCDFEAIKEAGREGIGSYEVFVQ